LFKGTLLLCSCHDSNHEIKDHLKTTEEEEQKLASNLSDKYGRGSLDIETGTFTPTK
jgi:hypothetical protein